LDEPFLGFSEHEVTEARPHNEKLADLIQHEQDNFRDLFELDTTVKNFRT
jgi:hypothetical protein